MVIFLIILIMVSVTMTRRTLRREMEADRLEIDIKLGIIYNRLHEIEAKIAKNNKDLHLHEAKVLNMVSEMNERVSELNYAELFLDKNQVYRIDRRGI